MSERELRKLISEPLLEAKWEDINVWRERLAKALTDEPDVVKAAREIMAMHAETRDQGPTTYSAIACGTLWEVRKMLEERFHFRLTETDWGGLGWEWTE